MPLPDANIADKIKKFQENQEKKLRDFRELC